MVRGWLMGVLLVVPAVVWAGPSATLGSLEGDVSVLRAGKTIASERIAEGFALEPFDTVLTGTAGRAEVRWAPSLGLTGSVRLDPASSVYLEFSPLRSDQTVGVIFLSGSLSVVLGSPGASRLEVRTGSAVFVGAKPGFRVLSSDQGDVLVTSRGPAVQGSVGDRTWSADGASALEVSADGPVRALASNPSTTASLESGWLADRRQAFRDQVGPLFRKVAVRYQRQLGQFERAWERYQREASDRGGVAVARLRLSAGPLERTLPTLRALRQALDDGLLAPSLEVVRGYSARDFFRQAAADEAPWYQRLAEAREAYRTAADKNAGVFPVAREGAVITVESDYFH